ncbi:hypothetical protein A3Q56_00712 [Intoshia linei]|uniref:Uncharacterized protein n=1 Tax=Intoshia linei TaxID=1819745 RepID=A0A177BB72_9BILA|nr:hypothetical protein A3Q56_00712 [Intoshia linei]
MQYADAYGDESLTTLRHISFGSLSKLPAIIWKLLNNLPFMFVVISTTFDSFLMNGFVTFIPKIMETQFTLSPSGASLYSGCVIIPAGFFGTVISGYIIKNMSNLKKIGFAAAVFCISIPFVFIFLLNCSTVPVVGMQRGYDYKPGIEVKGPVTIYDECNNNCNCPKPRGEYICRLNVQSEDPLLAYPSLCWAGCSNITDTKAEYLVYSQYDILLNICICEIHMNMSDILEEMLNSARNTLFNDKYAYYRETTIECTCLKANSTILSRDQCENLLECYNLYIFLLGLSVIVFLTFMASTPLIHVIIRVVPYTQTSIALGLSWLFARTFGTIPGPIFFGWLIDMSCLSFSDSSICLYYDNNMMKKMILAISIIIRSISFITLCIACLVYKL